jgi:hypothetical protein
VLPSGGFGFGGMGKSLREVLARTAGAVSFASAIVQVGAAGAERLEPRLPAPASGGTA